MAEPVKAKSKKGKINVACRAQACRIQKCLADNDFNQAECKYAIDELVECCQQKHARDAVQCSGFQSLIDSHSAIVSSNGLVREIVQEIPEEN